MPNPQNHVISLDQAKAMTTRYRENKNAVLAPGYPADILAICETFSKDAVQKLLNETGAASLRIYYGMDDTLKIHAILVAADAEGKDLLPAATASLSDDDDFEILEDAVRCPPECPPPSDLNQP